MPGPRQQLDSECRANLGAPMGRNESKMTSSTETKPIAGVGYRGKGRPAWKLTDEQVDQLRRRHDAHMQARLRDGFKRARNGFVALLAEEFRISRRHVVAIVARELRNRADVAGVSKS